RLGTGGRLPCGRRRCSASELDLATVVGAQAQHESRAAALPDRGEPVAEAERGGGLLQGLGLDFDALEGEQLDRGQLSEAGLRGGAPVDEEGEDRKSTRLNSSHVSISYAVFCLKKKNIDIC